MATFAWVGKNRQGVLQKGELSAKTRDEVIHLLRKQNILATSIQKKAKGLGGGGINIPGMGGGCQG